MVSPDLPSLDWASPRTHYALLRRRSCLLPCSALWALLLQIDAIQEKGPSYTQLHELTLIKIKHNRIKLHLGSSVTLDRSSEMGTPILRAIITMEDIGRGCFVMAENSMGLLPGPNDSRLCLVFQILYFNHCTVSKSGAKNRPKKAFHPRMV